MNWKSLKNSFTSVFHFEDLCSEIKCGIDAVKTPHASKPEECTCKCPEEAKGDPFFKCEGKRTFMLHSE